LESRGATPSWLLAIAELDAVIEQSHAISRRVEAALLRSSIAAQPALDRVHS